MSDTANSCATSTPTPSWANAAAGEMSSQFPLLSDTTKPKNSKTPNQTTNQLTGPTNDTNSSTNQLTRPSTSNNTTTNQLQDDQSETNGAKPYPVRKGPAPLPFGRKMLPGCKYQIPPIPYKVITNSETDHSRTAYMILDPA